MGTILFLHRVAHSIHVRLAQYPPGILRLVGHCMSLAWWRHFRLQLFTDVHIFSSSFRRRWNGTELQVAARFFFFALLCRAVRKQIASRRKQYIKRGGEPRIRDEFLRVGGGLRSVVEKGTSVPCLPRLETFPQLSRQ